MDAQQLQLLWTAGNNELAAMQVTGAAAEISLAEAFKSGSRASAINYRETSKGTRSVYA